VSSSRTATSSVVNRSRTNTMALLGGHASLAVQKPDSVLGVEQLYANGGAPREAQDELAAAFYPAPPAMQPLWMSLSPFCFTLPGARSFSAAGFVHTAQGSTTRAVQALQ